MSGSTSDVPNVSTITDTGCATPIAYATCTSQRVAMPGGDHVLGDVAHRVRGRAVDLGRVLAAERAATVTGHAAVGVDDDLAAGEPAVGVRAAELERAGRVAEHLVVVALELLGHRGLDHVLDEVVAHLAVDVDARRVLARDEHGRQAPPDGRRRRLDRHLGLAVGPQVVEHALLAHRGEPAGETVREPDRHRHEVVGVVAGVPEHHPLVAGAHLVVVVGEPSRISLALSTPWAMSGDCSSIDVITAQVLASKP